MDRKGLMVGLISLIALDNPLGGDYKSGIVS
jgi:hypothetical protein